MNESSFERTPSYMEKSKINRKDEKNHDQSTVRWTLEEDLELLQKVISAQVNIDNVADIEIMHVDWDKLSEERRFGNRSKQSIQKHWQRRIYPVLVEELNLTDLLKFRINLVTRILDQRASIRREIDWDKLAAIFHPRTKRMLQKDLQNIIHNENAEDFTYKLKGASRRMSNMLTWPEAKLVRHFHQEKRESYMREMRYAAEKMMSLSVNKAKKADKSDPNNN